MLQFASFSFRSRFHCSAYREVTGKRMLLQKIREMNRNENKYPVECTHDPNLGLESNIDAESEHLWLGKQCEPELESPQTHLESSVKEPKQQR